MFIRLLVGLALLLFGRKLFWLFVGGIGFVFGFEIAALLFRGAPELLIVAIALVAGIIGAVLAIFFQRVAVSVAGFIAGGYIVTTLLNRLGADAGAVYWILFLVGGILGAIFVSFLFDWALIVLSSLTGATVVIRVLELGPVIELILFVVLLIVGLGVQAYLLQQEEAR